MQLITFPLQQPVAIFLMVLVMILVTPVLLRRLGVPHIVGMILAGIVVGPYGVNLLARDASFEIFGQVGILYLMFLAGVEIDMPGLKKNWQHGVKFGVISFLLPMAAGIIVCFYALQMSILSSALIGAMLASHTLISYPIVTRFGLSNSRSSVIAVCGTIVAVLLSLMVLAEVTQTKASGGFSASSLLLLVVYMCIYAIFIWYALRWATRSFFRRFSDIVTQFIFVLAEVFFASLLAQIIGLEAILGAFYAGLVLNRFIPSRSGLMSRIEFVGNAIFIPYFLIGVGMLMNVGVIFNGWSVLIIALTITFTALVSKWVAAWLCVRSFSGNEAERRLIFGLSSGKAAATIAATMIGFRYGIIPEDVMNSAVIMILICCGVASVVTERAAMKLRMAIAEENLDEEEEKRAVYARQLVAVANPMTAEGIIRMAMYMRHSGNKHPITALFIRTGDDPTLVSMGRNALKDAVRTGLSADIKVDDVERYDTNIVAGLTNVLKEKNCTEIIIGLHRKSNIVDTFYGSMTEGLLRASNKMVIMSRCFVPIATLHRIVVVVPGKAEYETGFSLWLTRVCMLASQVGCRIVFIAYKETASYIRGAVNAMGFELRLHFTEITEWDDFITASGTITDEDLLIVVGARKTSISYSSDLESLPGYLARYFARHNILVIFPEQFGAEAELPTPMDFLSTNIVSSSGWNWKERIRQLSEILNLHK
ncbi:MAG: cation:proton antiporter [Prevotella sp.]|nr:cation:proton antiporter [Prevotella sp.]MCM1075647.1 cation:proton antiporter [Ruminococcus sp.]